MGLGEGQGGGGVGGAVTALGRWRLLRKRRLVMVVGFAAAGGVATDHGLPRVLARRAAETH